MMLVSQFSNLSFFCDLELRSGTITEATEKTSQTSRNQSQIVKEIAIEVDMPVASLPTKVLTWNTSHS